MDVDVAELRQFYTTPLGAIARRIVATRIRSRWRQTEGLTVVGLGYAVPFLGSFQGRSHVVGALMTATQGALVWPHSGRSRTVMIEEDQLPLADNSVDRLLVVHLLEASGTRAPVLLREMWRVLKPEGRVLLVVPNRRGLWARRDVTPFGHGQPFSRGQIERLLVSSMFSPIDWGGALHVPPFDRRLFIKSAAAFERAGNRLWPGFAGVLMVEARKETVAPLGEAVSARRARLLPVTMPTGAKRKEVEPAARGDVASPN